VLHRPPELAHIGIGDRTFVNFGAVFLDAAPITIGSDVQVGPNVQLLTPTHELDADRRRAGWERASPVTIGDNVWLGGGVIVCPGVTIGDHTVVGAGAVVTKDLPTGVLAVGAPRPESSASCEPPDPLGLRGVGLTPRAPTWRRS
jgi:maltose O-acetyltransferase